MGSLRVGHDWVTSLSLFTFLHWRRKWQHTPVFLPGESQGRGSLVGCSSWTQRVRHDWACIHTGPRSQGSPWARRKLRRKGKGRLWNVSGQAAGGDKGPNDLHLKSHSPVGRCLKYRRSLPQMDCENWEECSKVPAALYFKKICS